MQPVRVMNMTKLFDKELLIYSFFDINLSKPARIIWFVYFFLLFGIIGLPILIFAPLNIYTLVIALGIPIGGASLMSKPIWEDKKFGDYIKTKLKYAFSEPKVFYDNRAGQPLADRIIDNEILITRRKDYVKLLEIEQRRIDDGEKGKVW